MATNIWTQTDIDTLKAAIASGVLSVRYDGPPARVVTYQNTNDMLKALALMRREVAASEGRSSVVYASTCKGL